MSDFWAYTGGDILAMVLIIVLCTVALYHAKTWHEKL